MSAPIHDTSRTTMHLVQQTAVAVDEMRYGQVVKEG